MRLRIAALASLAGAVVLVGSPAVAMAARHHGPRHNHGLTIAATPDPIIAGEGVLIYGQLNGPNSTDQRIVLYHRVNPNPSFTVIGTTTTDSHGFYEFTRPDGLVQTNREWFTRAPGEPGHVHSRTVHERVAALVTLASNTSSADTSKPVTFSGSVTPGHAGQGVVLQQQVADNGNGWKTIKGGRLDGGSQFSIPVRFRTPGDYEIRAVFRGDRRNTRAASDPLTVSIQQAQVPDFTIQSSSPIIDYGSSATISGNLYLSGTTTPDPDVSVTLWGRTSNQQLRTVGLPVMTGADGSYSFSVAPAFNTVYVVRTTNTPPARRSSARLFEGVRDVVSIGASSPTAVVGQTVTFTGTVSPDKEGHAIYLERLGADGNWHAVEVGMVHHDSTYSLPWKFGNVGSYQFRARIPGGPRDVSGVSASVTVAVSLPPVSTLPAAPAS